METPEYPQDVVQLTSLVSANADTARQLYARSAPAATDGSIDGGGSSKRQKTEDVFADPVMKRRYLAEYADVQTLPASLAAQLPSKQSAVKRSKGGNARPATVAQTRPQQKLIEGPAGSTTTTTEGSATDGNGKTGAGAAAGAGGGQTMSLVTRGAPGTQHIRPEWHAPWKLMRVISGHLGWVRALAVEPDNKWFASGAGDRTIKIWDLATGGLKLTLTGHISTVRGLAVSPRHPYLFSCGEDKMVKCWDLETNKVIRHYHGHLSGVYALDIHPTLDVLVTGGRDGVARVWDMRTRSNIHVLSGHTSTVSDLKCQEADPQVITASLDSTVRLWDLAAGKTMGVLTHHKKGVRALATHPAEFTFASASTGSIKQWKCPEASFMMNFDGHNSIINSLSVNQNNVLFSGGKLFSLCFASSLAFLLVCKNIPRKKRLDVHLLTLNRRQRIHELLGLEDWPPLPEPRHDRPARLAGRRGRHHELNV